MAAPTPLLDGLGPTRVWVAAAFLLGVIAREVLGGPEAAGRALQHALELAEPGGRALPVWLNGPEGHGLFRGDDHPHPEPAEAITAELLRTAGVAVTGVGIDELDAALTAGPRHGRDGPRPPARIEFTAAGTAGPRQMTARIGYALALAAATGAPIQVGDQVMDQLAVSAQDDLLGQFTRDVPLPRPKHHRFARLFRGHPRTA